jgi:hypothetical protein
MQHHVTALAIPRTFGCLRALATDPMVAGLRPPRVPRTAGGLSGRPTCRIFARGDAWMLELDMTSGGWLESGSSASRRIAFPTLAAAIGYAERHGLNYRIERPRQHQGARGGTLGSRRLPRSWRASHGRADHLRAQAGGHAAGCTSHRSEDGLTNCRVRAPPTGGSFQPTSRR